MKAWVKSGVLVPSRLPVPSRPAIVRLPRFSLLQPITLKAASTDTLVLPLLSELVSVAAIVEVFSASSDTSPDVVVTWASWISAVALPTTKLVATTPPAPLPFAEVTTLWSDAVIEAVSNALTARLPALTVALSI